MARGLEFQTWVEEGLYYPYSENKGADQLRGNREADLRLCFLTCKKPVFSLQDSYEHSHQSKLLHGIYTVPAPGQKYLFLVFKEKKIEMG